MSDFVHCNKCFSVPDSAGTRKFFLTSCGHLFCQHCGDRVINEKCFVCNQQCSAVELSREMRSDLRDMFMNPVHLVKKFQRSLNQALEFQQAHRSRFLFHLKEQAKKGRKMYEYYQVEQKKKQELEKELKQLHEERRQLLAQLQRHSTTTTPGRAHNPNMTAYRSTRTPRIADPSVSAVSFRSTQASDDFMPAGASASNVRISPMFHQKAGAHVQAKRVSSTGAAPLFRHSGLDTPRMLRVDGPVPVGSQDTVASVPYDEEWRNNGSPLTIISDQHRGGFVMTPQTMSIY